MKLQRFKRTEKKLKNKPMISIFPKKFSLNVIATKRYFKGKNHVELFYDEEAKVIGIRPVEKETNDSFEIRFYRPTSPTAAIWCGEFIRKLKLIEQLKKLGKKNFLLEQKERTFLFQLK